MTRRAGYAVAPSLAAAARDREVLAKAKLTPTMELLMGHIGQRPWGEPARSMNIWHGLRDRGLTVVTRTDPPSTEFTDLGRRVLAALEARRVARG